MLYLFDLDGTLIKTDNIYFRVWKNILEKFNIELNNDIYKKYIYSNSDKYVKERLLCDVNITLEQLKNLKDENFLLYINEIIIIDGALEYINKIKKNNIVGIVTNCNKLVAKKILEFINLDVNILITSDDVTNQKPNSEPYELAIKKSKISNNDTIIFEDSKTGIISALGVNPYKIIGITTFYNSEQLLDIGVDYAINDYLNFDISLIKVNNFYNSFILKLLKNKYNNIEVNNNALKSGFIADILITKFTINNNNINAIFKYRVPTKSSIATMAEKLDLHNREFYFYESISSYVNINIPKHYGVIKCENLYNIGILLEDYSKYDGFEVGIDLNNKSIDISLKIIDRMALFHSKFWNKDLKKAFPLLNANNSCLFNPFLQNFIDEKYTIFKEKWANILNINQLSIGENIKNNFTKIQEQLSDKNQTIVHGDIKSPNIFYDSKNNYEPYFIDWQHIVIGKGVQDLIFFIIESFELENQLINFYLFKNYYYKKIIEYGVTNYTYLEYSDDLINALHYTPFFTAIWFGTVNNDELIDKNWPFFFIQKVFYLIENINK